MEDAFRTFDATGVLFWVAPGAFFILFRSFALRGAFPLLARDDAVAFIVASAVYWYLLIWASAAFLGSPQDFRQHLAGAESIVALAAIPAAAGVVVGLFERRDMVGKLLRIFGVRFLSPYATAWESVVVNLTPGSVLIVHLKDAEPIIGRWTNTQIGSAASIDKDVRDLYLDEIGSVIGANYQPFAPARGAYIAAEQIQFIEVIAAAV
jgi:hypothetical protein